MSVPTPQEQAEQLRLELRLRNLEDAARQLLAAGAEGDAMGEYESISRAGDVWSRTADRYNAAVELLHATLADD